MSDEAVRRGHVGFWLNKHFRLYGECHAAPIKRLGEALLLLESWGGVLELACFVIINQSCLFFFFPLNCSSGKKRPERPSLQLAAVSGFVPQFPHLWWKEHYNPSLPKKQPRLFVITLHKEKETVCG